MKRTPSGLSLVIGVDKPLGMTSHDVVARLRRALGERRIGHAGTLDPLASGVMVVGVGPATRLLNFALAQDKRYVARFAFGAETQTDDAEGCATRTAPAPERALDAGWAAAQMGILLAMTEQTPPAFSAVQVGGVRAYDAARKGEALELATRPVRVEAAQLLAVGAYAQGESAAGATVWWDVALAVSKGTYVRSLARDLGRALGSACHVAALRRTASGPVALSACRTLGDVEAGGAASLRPIDPVSLLGALPLRLGEDDVRAVRDGKRLSVARTDGGRAGGVEEGGRLALVREGRLYAVARRQGPAVVCEAVFPEGVCGCGRKGCEEER